MPESPDQILVDAGLVYSPPHLAQLELRLQLLSQDGLDCACDSSIFPSDYELAWFAVNSYSDNSDLVGVTLSKPVVLGAEGEAPVCAWMVLATATNPSEGGYHGTAYWNPVTLQLVVAHRGTADLDAGLTDFDGIITHQLTGQIHSACTFVERLLHQLLSQMRKAKGNDDLYHKIQLSFTGHSLGAWLAQITTFSVKYLIFDSGSGSFKRQDCNSCLSLRHAHTVVLDSPGARDMLYKIAGLYWHSQEVDDTLLRSLDITLYLAWPNLINTLNRHVGRLYQLNLDLRKLPECDRPKQVSIRFREVLKSSVRNYTKFTHKSQGLLDSFGPEQRHGPIISYACVSSWPRYQFPEYKGDVVGQTSDSGFLSKLWTAGRCALMVKRAGAYVDLDQVNRYFGAAAHDMDDKYYKVKAAIIGKPEPTWRQFSACEQEFLRTCLLLYSELTSDVFRIDEQLRAITDRDRTKLLDVLAYCKLPDELDARSPISSALSAGAPYNVLAVVDCVKQFVRAHPTIPTTLKRLVSEMPTLYENFYQTYSEEYLKGVLGVLNVEDWELDADSMHKFVDVLNSTSTLQIITNQSNMSSDIILRLLAAYSVQKTSSCILSLAHLIKLKRFPIDVVEVFKSRNSAVDNVLVIDARMSTLMDEGSEGARLIQQLSAVAAEKKLIVITEETVSLSFPNAFKSITDSGRAFADLNPQSRCKLLNTKITFQGRNDFRLHQFFPSADGSNYDYYALNEMLDSAAIHQLMICNSTTDGRTSGTTAEFIVGQSQVCTSDTGACTVIVDVDVESPEHLFRHLHTEAKQRVCVCLLISAEKQHEIDQVSLLLRQLDLQSHLNLVGMTTETLSGYDGLNRGDEMARQRFRKLCRDPRWHRVYWLTATPAPAGLGRGGGAAISLRWKQVYDQDLYKPRTFYTKIRPEKYWFKNEFAKTSLNDRFAVRESDKQAFIELVGLPETTVMRIVDVISPEIISSVPEPRHRKEPDYGDVVTTISAQMQQQMQTRRHHLRLEDGQIYWDHSEGSNINFHGEHDEREDQATAEVDFALLCRRLIVITGEPGMGKSTTLVRLVEIKQLNLGNRFWILQFNLRSCERHLYLVSCDEKSASRDLVLEEVANFLFFAAATADPNFSNGCTSSSHFTKQLLRHSLRSGGQGSVLPLQLIFDGFDEIVEPKQANKFLYVFSFLLKFTSASLLITTRYTQKHLLESTLGVFAIKFKEIEPVTRIEYLQQFWGISTTLERFGLTPAQEYAAELLKVADSVLGERLRNGTGGAAWFMGIPLQLRMLAEAFQLPWQQDQDIALLSVSDLYRRFVNVKYEIYLRDKIGMNTDNHPKEFVAWIQKSLTTKHKRLACVELFSDGQLYRQILDTTRFPFPPRAYQPTIEQHTEEADTSPVFQNELFEICRVGLVQSTAAAFQTNFDDYLKSLTFIHRTFAEYFTSLYFLAQLSSKNEYRKAFAMEVMKKANIWTDADCQMIRLFFNEMMADHPNIQAMHNLQVESMVTPQRSADPLGKRARNSFTIAMVENAANLIPFLLSECTTPEDLRSVVLGTDPQTGAPTLHVAVEANSCASVTTLFKVLRESLDGVALVHDLLHCVGTHNLELSYYYTGRNAFHLACEAGPGFEQMINTLFSPFEISNDSEGLLEYLNVRDSNGEGRTGLEIAIQNGHVCHVDSILDSLVTFESATPNANVLDGILRPIPNRASLLQVALLQIWEHNSEAESTRPKVKVLDRLFKIMASANVTQDTIRAVLTHEHNRKTILYAVAELGDQEIMRMLLEVSKNVSRDPASARELFKLLLEFEYTDAEREDSSTPLLASVDSQSRNGSACFRILFDTAYEVLGPDELATCSILLKTNACAQSILFIAVVSGNCEMVREVLRAVSLCAGSKAVLKMMVDREDCGSTPLSYARDFLPNSGSNVLAEIIAFIRANYEPAELQRVLDASGLRLNDFKEILNE